MSDGEDDALIPWQDRIGPIASAVRLDIPEARREGVARFLALAAEMNATLERVDLGDDLALAPVFRLPGRNPAR